MSLEVNVTKRFDGFTLHAAFTAGDTATALLGASGCGKSIHIVAGADSLFLLFDLHLVEVGDLHLDALDCLCLDRKSVV